MSSGILGTLGGILRGPDFTQIQGVFGGFMRAKARGTTGAEFGGIMLAPDNPVGPASFGGFLLSVDITKCPPVFFGGAVSGAQQADAIFGGFMIGQPSGEELIEAHARTLVKARSSLIPSQDLNIDAQLRFIGRSDNDFNAELTVEETSSSDFNAQFDVFRNVQKNIVFITDVQITPPIASGALLPLGSGKPTGSWIPGNGVTVTVTANGTLGDADRFLAGQIDFGEPKIGSSKTPFFSVSGIIGPPPWTASYTYTQSGIYHITARGVDNLGTVNMDHMTLNLASGLIPGIDYPHISISGIPRQGFVPPSLQVDFTVVGSGFQLRSPTDPKLFWTFGDGQRSNNIAPTAFYHHPGCYIAIGRYRHEKVSGGKVSYIWTGDTLLIGFGR